MIEQIKRTTSLNVPFEEFIMYIKEKEMCTVSVTEFRNNFKKYAEIAEKEEICVTNRDKPVFMVTPIKKAMQDKAKSFFDLLPSDAEIGNDSEERTH